MLPWFGSSFSLSIYKVYAATYSPTHDALARIAVFWVIMDMHPDVSDNMNMFTSICFFASICVKADCLEYKNLNFYSRVFTHHGRVFALQETDFVLRHSLSL